MDPLTFCAQDGERRWGWGGSAWKRKNQGRRKGRAHQALGQDTQALPEKPEKRVGGPLLRLQGTPRAEARSAQSARAPPPAKGFEANTGHPCSLLPRRPMDVARSRPMCLPASGLLSGLVADMGPPKASEAAYMSSQPAARVCTRAADRPKAPGCT